MDNKKDLLVSNYRKDESNHILVSCPKCGWEYSLGEIFYTDYLFGQDKMTYRDDDGKIINITDLNPPTYTEEFICENPECNCSFKVFLDIKPKIIYNIEDDFSEDWSIRITENEQK